MSNPSKRTPKRTNKDTKNEKVEQPPIAVGSAAWDAERWRNQWLSLSAAITETQEEMSRRLEELPIPAAMSVQEKADLCSAIRWLIETPPGTKSNTQLMKALEPLAKPPFVDPKTGEQRGDDEILQQYYIPATLVRQIDLLDKLGTFSAAVFDFLHEGFYPVQKQVMSGTQTAPPTLSQVTNALFFASAQYTPNYVLGNLLEQISVDLNIIQQAFQQRQSQSLREKLFVADHFANLALRGIIENQFIALPENPVLCYLNQNLKIRLLPYAEQILIAVPFTANVVRGGSFAKMNEKAYVSTDYLAIPHEIGHYLYQNGKLESMPLAKLMQGQLRQKLAEQPGKLQSASWIFSWLEEIFADAFGCLVAGPVSVLGFIEMIASGLPRDQHQHSDKHPIAHLRPLLQSQILRAIQDGRGRHLYKTEAEQLDAHWQQWVKDHWSQWVDGQFPYGYGKQTDILGEASYEIEGQSMPGKAILAELQPAIDLILDVLKPLRPEDMRATWTPKWNAKQAQDGQALTGLFAEFKQFAGVEGLLSYAETIPTADPADTQPGEKQNDPSLPSRWLSKQLTQLEQDRFLKPGFDRLVEALLFEGWSTEGPGPGQVGG